MPYYERGPARIHYEEIGSGFPLLLIPGGGLNSALSSWQTASPFNPMETYKDDFRCICAGLRNALPGQSSGYRPELPDLFYQNNIKGWGPALRAKRPDVTMDQVHAFLTSMYTDRADFVFTVSREFVRSIQTPLLIAPDNVPAHPYQVAMEVARLAQNAEVTIYPWKDSPEHIDQVVEHARRFLKAHEPIPA